MVVRILLRYLLNNEQLIQRLADSYPFRRAAQLTAHLLLKGKSLSQESIELMSTSNLLRKLLERLSLSQEQAKQFSTEKAKRLEVRIAQQYRKTMGTEWLLPSRRRTHRQCCILQGWGTVNSLTSNGSTKQAFNHEKKHPLPIYIFISISR